MKHTLKTRPTHNWMLNNLDKIEDVEQWFVEFEWELRQRKQEIEERREKDVMFEADAGEFLAGEDNRGDVYCRGKEDGELEVIKKVLGVAET